MAELATLPENRGKLTDPVTAEMVSALEPVIDDVMARFPMPTEFVIPGATRLSALLDVARTVVRRAERESLAVVVDGSHVVAYLNLLSYRMGDAEARGLATFRERMEKLDVARLAVPLGR